MSLEIRTVVAEGPFESAVSFRRVPWTQTRRMRFTFVFSEVRGGRRDRARGKVKGPARRSGGTGPGSRFTAAA